MSLQKRITDDRVREALRQGDPARYDRELTPTEREYLRATIPSSRIVDSIVRRSWAWLPLGACALVVLLVLAATHDFRIGDEPALTPVVTVSLPTALPDAPVSRQVHLTTKNGTRIIWILNPAVSF